jgi:hypothetical protein
VPGGTCKTIGDSCTGNNDCCSTLCQNNTCRRAFTCQANSEIGRAHV